MYAKFSEKLTPDTLVYVSGGRKCYFVGNVWLSTKWMISGEAFFKEAFMYEFMATFSSLTHFRV